MDRREKRQAWLQVLTLGLLCWPGQLPPSTPRSPHPHSRAEEGMIFWILEPGCVSLPGSFCRLSYSSTLPVAGSSIPIHTRRLHGKV